MKGFVSFLICIFLLSINPILAQDNRTDRIGIGVGPSFMYGDNTGVHSKFKFKVLPALSLDYQKKINPFFDVKGTIGWQLVGSGDHYTQELKESISIANQPYGFSGSVFFGDIMPIYHFNPNLSGYIPSLIKVYSGLGLGYFYSSRTDEKLLLDESMGSIESYKASDSGIYIPFRVGAFKNLQSDADIGLEATLIYSPFSELEGNDLQQKRIRPDMLMQFQFYYRIHIGQRY
ncbi:hypothetical protein Q4534_08795 [Cyclobacterium sp. 1_MG-2023]|uniref:hypothetical protein n=1 Tax=Cyclobacterium sp. 1_MG-2023 TaxID=3062681 RepID=UPI0026E432E1|nr:hypothetical protein [Cyclobacterium sp. 1_MG-2023]MDO6437501.1 hypothetical protein [Cyclobacterium sp. 1_MG-2023]